MYARNTGMNLLNSPQRLWGAEGMSAEEEITSKTTYETRLLVTGKPSLQYLEAKMDKSCHWFFFLKAPEDRTLLWEAAAGSWQLLPFRKLQTKATCTCLFGLGKHWFASLCQRSGFSWGQGKDFSRHHSHAMQKQPKLYSWNSKLGFIFPHMYHASFSGFRNLLGSRDELWISGSGTPQPKSKPALGKAHVWIEQVNNSCQIRC